MNNEQFRRLLADNSSSKPGDKPSPSARNAAAGGATPGGLLGSRMRSSIPMTPYVSLQTRLTHSWLTNLFREYRRSVSGVDFARQLAEQRGENDQRPSKRFKSSAAPKGTKLPTGYQDRAQLRNAGEEEEGGDDIAKRIKALEEMVKLGQIDQVTFDKLRVELGVGGDTESTHMVKGLDWDLLRRVKAGEDVSKKVEKPEDEEAPATGEDAEEEFERLMEEKGRQEIASAPKEQKEKKKGNMAPPPPKKKTRDEILKELRESRAAASAPAPKPESTLGSKFKKLGDGKPEKKRFVETDDNGRRREVLLITDAQGNTKRKTRWLDKPGESGTSTSALPMPDKDTKPLGMEVPAEIAARVAAEANQEDEDDDIFAGVGAEYNPLAGLEDDGSSSSDDDDEGADNPGKPSQKPQKTAPSDEDHPREAPSEATAKPAKPRNYFGTTDVFAAAQEPEDRSNPLTKDPTILAALKRAAALRLGSPSANDDDDDSPETSQRHKKFLEEARRRDALDAADLDFGFGGSRIEDGEEEEGVLLDFDDDRGGKKRKRGPKKRKGDKDSAADVMNVLEGRKKAAE